MTTIRTELVWLPLGAGGRCVRLNGRVYERALATAQRRTARDLFHAALLVHLPEGTTVVEVAPVWDVPDGRPEHGAVVSGPVGLRALGRWDLFRYEVRSWRDGIVPDLADAVGDPVVLTHDELVSRWLLDLVPAVPALTWGRDERGLGEMWTSNSVVAWLLQRAGFDAGRLVPPGGGRAPGWDAGVTLARRHRQPLTLQKAPMSSPQHRSRTPGAGPSTSMGLHELVATATLAPSSHNTQPWLFVPSAHGVCVRADTRRRLPVADPDDRELAMSCGAAVLTFRVAAAAHGYGTRVGHVHPADPDDVACLSWTAEPDAALAGLADAVVERHVWRGRFADDALPDPVVAGLAAAGHDEGAALHVVPDGAARHALATLVAEADRAQLADRAWRDELATWMHPRGSSDGLARGRLAGRLAPWAIRHLDLGRLLAWRDRRRTSSAPLVVVLTTPGDTATDRLSAGQAFQRVSLLATSHGLALGLLNQPCQVPALRARLATLVPDGVPQLVLAIGRPRTRPTGPDRRLAGEVMSHWLGPAGEGIHPHPVEPHTPPRLLGGIAGR